jgi:integrase
LRKEVVAALRAWLRERDGHPAEALFPNARGGPLSRDGVEYLLAKHVALARQRCQSLKDKRVSPHVLRHYADLRTMPTGEQASLLDAPFDRAFVDLERASDAA